MPPPRPPRRKDIGTAYPEAAALLGGPQAPCEKDLQDLGCKSDQTTGQLLCFGSAKKWQKGKRIPVAHPALGFRVRCWHPQRNRSLGRNLRDAEASANKSRRTGTSWERKPRPRAAERGNQASRRRSSGSAGCHPGARGWRNAVETALLEISNSMKPCPV